MSSSFSDVRNFLKYTVIKLIFIVKNSFSFFCFRFSGLQLESDEGLSVICSHILDAHSGCKTCQSLLPTILHESDKIRKESGCFLVQTIPKYSYCLKLREYPPPRSSSHRSISLSNMKTQHKPQLKSVDGPRFARILYLNIKVSKIQLVLNSLVSRDIINTPFSC